MTIVVLYDPQRKSSFKVTTQPERLEIEHIFLLDTDHPKTDVYVYKTRPRQLLAALVTSSEPAFDTPPTSFSDYGDIESEGSCMSCEIVGRIEWNPSIQQSSLFLGIHVEESNASAACISFTPKQSELLVEVIGSAFPS